MRRLFPRVAAPALAAAVLAIGPACATDGYFANSYGTKSIGMGGAAVAVVQEPFAGAVNPASGALLGNEWELGVSWFSPHRSASRSGSGLANIDASVTSGSDNFFIPEFGINWKYGPDLAFGVTVYGNGGMNTDYPGGQIPLASACGQFRQGQGAPYNLLCGTGSLGVDYSQLAIAPYVSWQFAKGQSIGVAPLITYQRFKAEGLQAFDNPGFSTSPGSVTNNGYDDSWGVGVRVGWLGQFSYAVALGVAYSSKISMGNFDRYRGLFAQQGGFDVPSSFGVGVALRPAPQWLIALDYERIFYDDVPSVNNPSALIGNCVAGQRSACLGGDGGAGFGWQNIDVWKIGVQYALNDQWTIRGGYNNSGNPVQPQDVTFNILAPGIVRNQYTAGATWRIDKESEVTGAFMYAANNSVSGPSLFVGFGLPPATTDSVEMKEYQVGLAYSRKF